MQEQNYKNHARMVPLFHYVLFLLIVALMAGSIVNMVKTCNAGGSLYDGSLLFVVSLITLLTAWYARSFALKAQDRAIRADENIRHFSMTGKLLDARLTGAQIVGLRFASDAEFVALAKRAAEEGLSQKEIKLAIQNWKADTDRV